MVASDAKTINVHAGTTSSGKPAYEELPVEERAPGEFLLLASPGLVLGIAAGDVIRLSPAKKAQVIERGGNLCIQIFSEKPVSTLEPVVTKSLAALGGRLDAKHASKNGYELVYTIHVDAGFAAVESALDEVVARFGEATWYFGNVYDPSDGVTPLNWW
jgi:hypothetical protein